VLLPSVLTLARFSLVLTLDGTPPIVLESVSPTS